MEDQPMFAVPPTYQRQKPPDAEKVSWGKHRGPRQTCGLCILDIRDGLLQHPMATATETFKRGTAVWYLCKSHAHEVRAGSRRIPA